MIIKQVTVIVENKEGKLKEVMDIITRQGIDVHALSMADTVTRLIVDDPESVKELLQDQGYQAELTDVISVTIPSKPGSLSQMLHKIAEAEINLEYMYAHASGSGMIFLPSDVEKTDEILKDWEEVDRI